MGNRMSLLVIILLLFIKEKHKKQKAHTQQGLIKWRKSNYFSWKFNKYRIDTDIQLGSK